MTRESEKSKIRMSVIIDGKHINSLKKADEVIDQIFDEFGEQLKDKDYEIELLKHRLKHRVEELIKPKTCYGCKHKPNDGECYYEPCGTCARFFYDHYEPKDNA